MTTQNKSSPPLTYHSAGVDIDVGNDLVQHIKTLVKPTLRKEVLGGIGGFAALFELPLHRYREPVLAASTDGVGTKLKLALLMEKHDTIGIDLVAMCVNDLIVCGAEPLFFLDYYATGKLSLAISKQILAGINQGCVLAGCALIGGETAEMPGLYQAADYDLAGFSVGVVEKSQIRNSAHVKPGQQLIGLASTGPHSNGYSLIRKIIDRANVPLDIAFEQSTLGEVLLTPTRIYVKTILALQAQMPIYAISHITGGGIIENLPRILPPQTNAIIWQNSWSKPAIFDWLQQQGDIADKEMWRVFNNGIGLILCVDSEQLPACLAQLHVLGETAWHIGHIASSTDATPQVILQQS